MYYSPAQWNEKLAAGVGWRDAYKAVEQSARAFLSTAGAGVFSTDVGITTTELVEHLYPEALARGDGITARQRIYKALAALSTRGLADCATRGVERRLAHTDKTIRPWLWHAPGRVNSEAEVMSCPNCGHQIAP